jgi:signal peptidase I
VTFYRQRLPFLLSLILAVVGVFTVHRTWWAGYEVPSPSMMPTLRVGDIVWVNKAAYGWRLPWLPDQGASRTPVVGDVIVFHQPKTGILYIKRVVGLPGNSVLVLGHRVWVNGVLSEKIDPRPNDAILSQLDSSLWAGHETRWVSTPDSRRYRVLWNTANTDHAWRLSGYWVVPSDHLFVMGDERDDSSDSRSWGMVSLASVVGRAVCVVDRGNPQDSVHIASRTGCHLDQP